MPRFARVEGVLVEPIGDAWAAYSPASCETILLNDESAAILEILEAGAASTEAIGETLATDSGLEVDTLIPLVNDSWPRLLEAGLVRQVGSERLLAA